MTDVAYRCTEEIDFSRSSDFVVTGNALTYPCRFEYLAGADRLFVALRSARVEPIFCYNPATEVNGHVLAISDPSLFLHEDMDTGCFLGTRDEDAVDGIISIADMAAQRLGLHSSRIIYWGISGCALGAAMAAVKSGARSVLINPMVDIVNMCGSRNSHFLAMAFGLESAEQLHTDFPVRTRLHEAMAGTGDKHFRHLVVQNLQDESFMKRQYEPFCRRMDIPLEGGYSPDSRIRTMLYSCPSGHAREPVDVRATILSEGVPWLLQPA
jgi:hypothetical protein